MTQKLPAQTNPQAKRSAHYILLSKLNFPAKKKKKVRPKVVL